MKIKLTKAEKRLIEDKLDKEDPFKVWTNRDNFINTRIGRSDHSYSTIRQLIDKVYIERIKKEYGAYERIQYRFTGYYLANAGVIERKPLSTVCCSFNHIPPKSCML